MKHTTDGLGRMKGGGVRVHACVCVCVGGGCHILQGVSSKGNVPLMTRGLGKVEGGGKRVLVWWCGGSKSVAAH